jgi:hypothetical protein
VWDKQKKKYGNFSSSTPKGDHIIPQGTCELSEKKLMIKNNIEKCPKLRRGEDA